MERSQAYHAHKRIIYGLMWPEAKRCYVGQTVDMDRRRKEHQRAWAKPFTMIKLGEMTGTRAQGEDHEFAWRYRCAESGWTPIAKTKAGEVFVSRPHRHMTPARMAIARRCKWPAAYRVNRAALPWWFQWMFWQGAALAGVVLTLRLPL